MLLVAVLTTPAFAITEAEVEAQVSTSGKESVTGSVLIWFLCAVGFLKVSQKIDSFMASLGVNVGHTGGSMLAEAMIVTRGIATVAGAAGHVIGGISHRAGSSSRAASSSSTSASPGVGFFKGGLAGMVGRKVTNDAVRTATTTTSAVNTVKSSATEKAARTTSHESSATTHQSEAFSGSTIHSGTITDTNITSQSSTSKQASQESHSKATAQRTSATTRKSSHVVSQDQSSVHRSSIGGAIFAKSLASGGSFANEVISTVARGDLRSTGSMKGELASQALSSYMGFTALGEGAKDIPAFTNVEIGGGRITGIETAPGSSEGIAFGMYHADQYAAPQGEYTTIHSADGAKWYKQYAQDAVERKPYVAPDDTIAYHENIVKRLPDPPNRKDRM